MLFRMDCSEAFGRCISVLYGILLDRNSVYYLISGQLPIACEEMNMHSEIKELNRIICNECDEKEYEKCKICKIYQLVNKIDES